MRGFVSDVAFTPAVKAVQERLGSRRSYEKVERGRAWRDTITPDLEKFLAQRDSFYLGTATAEGQPYIQHRGGAKGFLKVLDKKTLAFADFSGNRQYVSMGNLSENDRVFLFLMDYPHRRRIKIWGHARVIEDDDELLERLRDPDSPGRPERAFVFTVDGWDINCPQHITPRYTVEEIAEGLPEGSQSLTPSTR